MEIATLSSFVGYWSKVHARSRRVILLGAETPPLYGLTEEQVEARSRS